MPLYPVDAVVMERQYSPPPSDRQEGCTSPAKGVEATRICRFISHLDKKEHHPLFIGVHQCGSAAKIVIASVLL